MHPRPGGSAVSDSAWDSSTGSPTGSGCPSRSRPRPARAASSRSCCRRRLAGRFTSMAFGGANVRIPHVPRPSRRARVLLIAALAVVLLLILGSVYVSLYTDLLWFRSVGFSSVFTRRIETKLLLFFLFGVLMMVVVGANIVIAHRLRPPFRPNSPEQQQLETLTSALHPARWWLLGGLLVFIGAITGAGAAARWRTWMLWRNGVHFGIKDPQFHKDVSYFAFTY